MAKTLELIFNGESGDVKISVKNPKESLTTVEIKDVMDQIILANSFRAPKGSPVGAKLARFIDRTVEDIELS